MYSIVRLYNSEKVECRETFNITLNPASLAILNDSHVATTVCPLTKDHLSVLCLVYQPWYFTVQSLEIRQNDKNLFTYLYL
jgi:hypothetical protein